MVASGSYHSQHTRFVGADEADWDVLFLDRLEPNMCVAEAGAMAPITDSWNVRYFLDVMHRFGFDGGYGLLCNAATSLWPRGRVN